MKKMLLLCLFFAAVLINAEAQTKSPRKKAVSKNKVEKKISGSSSNDTSTIVLRSTSNNAAYAAPQFNRLSIADPTINVMNMRASGADIKFRNSPIAGMPKSTYGIANGKILLRSSTASTSGTVFGSGAVGTGTSIMGTGTSEATIGVNGKSPYAGTWLWGDRRPVYNVPVRDSAKRQ
jgi:hypothetical protein